MDTLLIGGALPASRLALGCMRIDTLDMRQLARLVHAALDAGITYFDHADIYGAGRCELLFGQLLREEPSLRHQMLLQSKCGIRDGYYDFSKEHIIRAAEGSLRRLGVDTLDALLLHRPDALMEPDEVAEAFNHLEREGKVRVFGVSNQNPGQMTLLQSAVQQRLAINQLQLSVAHAGMIDAGLRVNMEGPLSADHDGGVLDYCRLHDVVIQPWSPFQYGFFDGVFLGDRKFTRLNRVLDNLAETYDVTAGAVALAWLLRHPARMQPILGSTSPERVTQLCAAADITLSRREWYEIYLAPGKKLP
ncbi:MAG: aldo/keto reductase [Eubacteriales bacterium]|nr:aldo/keto reductase [Eubacteriales bacterium]